MIGKAKSIAHTSNSVDYGKNKANSQEISRHNVIGTTGLEIENEFKVYQNMNSNARFNTITVVLSPAPEDGIRLTNSDFKSLTDDYLKRMNLQDHQHIAYLHLDTKQPHVHVYINRIDSKGLAYKDSFISIKTQNIVNDLAKERGFVNAREKMIHKKEKEQTHLKALKAEIFLKHKEVLQQRPNSVQDYIKAMDSKGLIIQPTLNSKKEIQGFRIIDRATNSNFKASEIHRSMSMGNIIKQAQLKNDLKLNLKTKTKKYKPIKKDLAFGLKQEAKSIKNNAEFQLKSTGISILKTVIKPPKMSREEYKIELKYNELFEHVKHAINLNESVELEAKTKEETTLKTKEQEQEKEPKSEPKTRDLEL